MINMHWLRSTLARGVVVAGLSAASLMAIGFAQPGDERVVLEWPSRTNPARSLQQVVDEAPDGSVVRIRGIHDVEPIWIRNKNLFFEGAGADGLGRTELARPVPDARDPIPDAAAAIGTFNFINSGGGAARMRFRGGDTAIVSRATADAVRGGTNSPSRTSRSATSCAESSCNPQARSR